MSMVIGIDPDAVKHGVAVYEEGILVDLIMLDLFALYRMLEPECGPVPPVVAVEDVMANQFVYRRNQKQTKAAENKVAMAIGRVQQAQVEVCRMLSQLGIEPKLFKPQKGNWAKNREQFERVTGWSGSSNEDTRAAAFFGFLALREQAA